MDSNLNTQEKSTKEQLELLTTVFKSYGFELLKYAWLILICAFLMGYFLRNRKLKDPTIYTADFSFKFNDLLQEEQNTISTLFGSSGTSASSVTLAKLKEIIFTRKIFIRFLFREIDLELDGVSKKDFIINHYLRNFYYKNKNSNNYFFETDSIDPYDRRGNYLLKYVHRLLVRDNLIIDPVGSIIHLKAKSTSEDFAYILSLSLFSEVESYYNNTAIEKKKRFFEMAFKRTKDLSSKLSIAEENYIRYKNSNSAEASGRNNILIKTQKLSTELKKATESYFAAQKTRDAAEEAFESQKQTTVFAVIDPPLFPLDVYIPNPFLHMVLGGVIGAGFAFVLIVARKFIKDSLIKDTQQPSTEADTIADTQV
jgi:hypothetical protein